MYFVTSPLCRYQAVLFYCCCHFFPKAPAGTRNAPLGVGVRGQIYRLQLVPATAPPSAAHGVTF